MFEKEAEEYVMRDDVVTENNRVPFDNGYGYQTVDFEAEVKKAFQDGAEFGYNLAKEEIDYLNQHWGNGKDKANEWHYVKDGLSEKEKYVLIYTDLKNVYIARLVEDNYFITNKGGFVQTSSVIAWKEIVLPELKESE